MKSVEKKDYIVFKEIDNNNEILDHVLPFKGEAKKFNKLLNIIYTY